MLPGPHQIVSMNRFAWNFFMGNLARNASIEGWSSSSTTTASFSESFTYVSREFCLKLSATATSDFKRKAWASKQPRHQQMVKVKKAKQAQLVTVPLSIDMCVKRVLATHTFCEEEVMHDKSSHDTLIDHAKVEQSGDIEVPVTAARHKWSEMMQHDTSNARMDGKSDHIYLNWDCEC